MSPIEVPFDRNEISEDSVDHGSNNSKQVSETDVLGDKSDGELERACEGLDAVVPSNHPAVSSVNIHQINESNGTASCFNYMSSVSHAGDSRELKKASTSAKFDERNLGLLSENKVLSNTDGNHFAKSHQMLRSASSLHAKRSRFISETDLDVLSNG